MSCPYSPVHDVHLINIAYSISWELCSGYSMSLYSSQNTPFRCLEQPFYVEPTKVSDTDIDPQPYLHMQV